MQYKYGLDPTSKKYKCPQCGHMRLVVYIDNETKAPVDQYKYGRCDRENECQYHVHPAEDPENADKVKTFVPKPPPVVKQIYPDQDLVDRIVKRTKTCVSPLHRFLNKKTISNDHLLRWGTYSDDDKTVYIFRNAGGQVCNMKWFKYDDTGHRDKGVDAFSLRNPPTPPSKDGQPDVVEKYMMCLFGEHLLDPSKQKIVCVVESEKSAVIASFFYNQFDWVSVGSASGLSDGKNGTPDKISPLKGRKVYWLCDADKAGRMDWKKKEGSEEYVLSPSSVRHLHEHGIDFEVVDLFPEKNNGYDIADAILDGLLPEIKPTEKPVNPSVIKAIEHAKEDEDDKESYYDLPNGCEWEKVKWDIRKYMHFEYKGRIYVVRKKRGTEEVKGIGTYYSTDITNFTIKSIGLIINEEDPSRLVEIKNIHGFSQVVKVPTKAFASQTEFTVFVESVGNFQYDGEGKDLKKIRSKLYDTMSRFEEVDSLGWHRSGNMIFANGVHDGEKFHAIDKYGFVKLRDLNFFIQPLSCITRDDNDNWEDEKKFLYKKRDVKLKDWSELFCRVYKDNGKIALAWYISSLYRDFIYRRFKFFPHIHLFGPPGTGKSQVGWSIRATVFTGLVKPFNLNTGTAVAFHRELSHFANTPAWFDEYDNSILFERIQSLKAAYDGVGHKKSVKDSDKRTKSTQVNRAVMITGQQLPTADNALFKRVILLQFYQTEYSEAEKKAFADLQEMESGGLSHITAGFIGLRKLIEDKFNETFDVVLEDLIKAIEKSKFDVEDRIVKNSAVILTTIKVLSTKIAAALPYTYEELLATVVKNIQDQMALISNTNETNTFWDTVVYLAQRGDIKLKEDFAFDCKKIVKVTVNKKDVMKELDHSTNLLMIRFTKIIPLYREAFKRQNTASSSPMDKGSLIHYLQHSKAYVGMVSNYDFASTRTSCYCFDYDLLRSMGIDLGSPDGVPIGTGGNEPGATSEAPVKPGSVDDMPF